MTISYTTQQRLFQKNTGLQWLLKFCLSLLIGLLVGCGGGFGSSLTPSPSPSSSSSSSSVATLQAMSPTTATSGSASIVLTLNGSNLVAGSRVLWNGTALNTSFVNSTQLSATVPSNNLANPGDVTVVVTTPDGNAIGSSTFNVASATPTTGATISGIAPTNATAGSPATTLTVSGTNFTASSVVKWNGTAVTTSYVSTTRLTAQIPQTDLTTATAASVTVSLGSNTSNTAVFTVTSANASSMALRVSGNHFVDANGASVQLRGGNLSVLEFWLIDGQDPTTPWGGQPNGNTTSLPNFSLMSRDWSMNVVRLPLNEASWLGLTCTDAGGAVSGRAAGTLVHADPLGNYKTTVQAAVAAANAAGLYVILDLHWAAPGSYCPMGQNNFADADNSINFWTSVANTFKGNPAVLFEAFNEPIPWWLSSSNNSWTLWSNTTTPTTPAGTFNKLVLFGYTTYQIDLNWNAASMQDIVNAIRATGATNTILIAGENWSGDLSGWLTGNTATVHDPLVPAQIGAVWHAYWPDNTSYTSNAYLTPVNQTGFPTSGPSPTVATRLGVAPGPVFSQVVNILNAGYPVIITEFGDQDVVAAQTGAALSTAAPFAAEILQFSDSPGAANGAPISYVAWSFNVNGSNANTLLKPSPNTTAMPSPGFGVYVQSHYQCRASTSGVCD